MQKYQENGQQIFDQFCSSSTPNSIMFPAAPEQTYVDIYPGPDHDQPGSNFSDERKRQSDYEAEVLVYRALEGLEKNLVVLHSFKYTHYQRCVISNNRCRCKNQNNVEGECDFLILGPNFCVIIEVKNSDTQMKALMKSFKDSIKQRSRMESLIKSIDPTTTVLSFTAYPNVSKSFKGLFQDNPDSPVSDNELSSIMFKEDILGQITELAESANIPESRSESSSSTSSKEQYQSERSCFFRFISRLNCCGNRNTGNENSRVNEASSSVLTSTSSTEESNRELATEEINRRFADLDKTESHFSIWWQDNVTREVSSAHITPQVRNTLLAIWTWSTKKKSCDLSKCSLGKCISDIDKELREGHITLKTKMGKKRDLNPEIFAAPDVIRKNIGVLNLTAQQKVVFDSNENLLWINGPAGAGKSVLLCGKIIQLVQEDNNNKVVLFRPETEEQENTKKLYECALDKANVQYKLIKYSWKHTTSEVCKLITESQCDVIIVEISGGADNLTGVLSGLYNFHVFIDDIQDVILQFGHDQVRKLRDTLLNSSVHHTVKVACDLLQWYYSVVPRNLSPLLYVIIDKISDKQMISLSMNLRNSKDISNILFIIRDMYIKSISENPESTSRVIDIVLPQQSPGHFIHGPRTTFHILDSINQVSVVLDDELVKLTSDNTGLKNSDVSVVHDYLEVESSVEDTVNRRCSNTDDKIAVCDIEYIYSTEWPAVVVVHGVRRSVCPDLRENLSTLYLQISRARVYCSVVVFPDSEEGYSELDKRYVLDLVDKLRGRAHFVFK